MRRRFLGLGGVLVAVLAACAPSGGSHARSITAVTVGPDPTPDATTSASSTVTTVFSASAGDGPVAAAIGFLELTEQVTSMTPDVAAAAQASISADSVRDALVVQTRDEVDRTVAAYDPGTIHLEITPLAARRTDSATGVTVAIWYLGIVTVDHGTAASYFRTATYSLVWEHDGWRMTSLDSTPGPTPTPTKDAFVESAEQLAGALDGFTRLAGPEAGR
jgi:hypothetical protein